MRVRTTRVATVALSAAALLAITSCAAGTPAGTDATPGGQAAQGWQAGAPAAWQDILNKAKGEGSVVVGGPAQLAQPLAAAFERDTGLKLEWVGGTGGQLSARLQQEVTAGHSSMDLKLGGAQELLLPNWHDLLQPIKNQLILPSVTDPSKWRSGGIDWYDPDKAYMLRGSAYVYGWPVVNSDIVKPSAITSWNDLLKPEYKGKIASLDISQPGSGQGTGHFLLNTLGPDYAASLYKGQQVTFTTDYDQAMQWLSRGTYPIVLGVPQSFVVKYTSSGVKAEPVLPPDHPGYLTSGFSVVMQAKGAPHPNAAQVFLNWYASVAGQQAYDNVMLEVSQRTDVDVSKLPDYLKPRSGAQYWNDGDLDWYLNKRATMNAQLTAMQKGNG